jgi:PAS domain S-box-containing protein
MAEGEDTGAAILKALKYNPRGMTVTDISKKIGCHRNSTGKQLEILRAGGKVDVRQIGSARVYSLSQRVPLSAFLCFTKNIILIVDQDLNVVQANDQYLNLSGLTKEELIGRNIHEGELPIVSTPEALGIIESTGKQQVVAELRSMTDKEEMYYKMEVIPTTFEDGDPGLTVLFEDITERKRHLKNMEFLARTAMELVDLPPETDIYQYISGGLKELIPENPRFYIHSYDEVKREFFMRALEGEVVRQGAAEMAGFDLVGMTFPVENFFYAAPFFESAATFKDMREMRFRPLYDEEQISFFNSCARIFPEEVCYSFLRTFNIGKIYLIGLVWQEKLFGLVGIFHGPGEELENQQAIESFLRQASIAIARRQTEERLSRSEQRFAELVSSGSLPPAVVVRDGRISLVNPQFTGIFGYTREDIPTLQEWLAKAIPDPEYREKLVSALNPDIPGAGDFPPRIFSVQCRNGDEKGVTFMPVILSDGTQVVTCEVKKLEK